MIEIEQIAKEAAWQMRHQVMYPEMDFKYIQLNNDDEALHFGLLKNKEIIAVVSLFKDGEDYQFRKFATALSEQGKGYGRMLLQYIIQYAEQQKAKRLWCNARTQAQGFYTPMGFTPRGEIWQDDTLHHSFVVMEKVFD